MLLEVKTMERFCWFEALPQIKGGVGEEFLC